MNRRVLIEGRNLVLREGTGIASYARNLAKTLRGLGYELDIVFDTDFPLSPTKPEWNEIRLYDHAGRGGSRRGLLDGLEKLILELTGAPLGVTPKEVAASVAAVDGSLFPGLASFDRRLAVYRLFQLADQHALRYGRCLRVRPSRRPAVFHVTHPAAVRVSGCANIYTIHDLVPLRLPHTTLDDKRSFHAVVEAIARTADRIVTVSDHSKQDLMRMFDVDEDRIVTTYQAVSLPDGYVDRPEEETAGEVSAFQLEPEKYFLFVGAIEPKKNLERLIDGFMAAQSDHPLVIVGKLGWGYDRTLAKIDSYEKSAYVESDRGKKRRIIRLSYLPLSQVVSLVRHARALLFPSVYEGFGLPVLEAMVLGTPVLAANTASLPEVTGDAAVTVDPYDSLAITRAIKMLDGDADLRSALSRRGRSRARFFSQEAYAERLDALYGSLI